MQEHLVRGGTAMESYPMRKNLFGGIKSFITSPPGYSIAGEKSSDRLDWPTAVRANDDQHYVLDRPF
jgi:hypothetical protein